MKNLSFYAERNLLLLGREEIKYDDSKYVVVGVPFDSTSSYRAGSRFGPDSIRKIFYQLETFDIETGIDFEDIPVYDGGNLPMETNIDNVLYKLKRIVSELVHENKVPIILGGEHTITLACIESVYEYFKDILYIVFDAHLDLRDEYPLGVKISHATVNRRVFEKIGEENIVIIGARAFSREEYEFVTLHNINVLNSIRKLNSFLDKTSTRKAYISIDLDVLDPSIAPGVGNPEPGGISLRELLAYLKVISQKLRVKAFDIVELNPIFDHAEITAAVASKIMQKTVTYIERFG